MVLVHAAQIFREKAFRPGEWTIEVITEYPDFVGLEDAWNALVERAGVDHPFLRHEWIRAWWESFGEGKKLHIVTLRSRDELVAIAPLMLTRARIYGLSVRTLQFIFNVHTPRLDVIAARSHREVCRVLWRYLRERNGLWDVVEMHQLPEGSRTLDELRRAAEADGYPAGIWRSDDSPYLALDGTAPDAYFAALPAKHRSNVRNRGKRLAKLGRVEIETIDGVAGLEAGLEDGFRIEAAAWKGEAQTAIRCDEQLRRFYTRAAQIAAGHGWLRLQFLTLDGRRIAFGYSLVYGQKLYLLKAGYDPEFAPYSPFNLLCERILRECFDEGLLEFDFLGAEADWKMRWTRTVRPHYWLFLFSRALRGRLIHWAKFRLATALRERRVTRRLVQWACGGAVRPPADPSTPLQKREPA
jgi:CelD/BcsL family acetyltransferase involved in cellulose biosynthesis